MARALIRFVILALVICLVVAVLTMLINAAPFIPNAYAQIIVFIIWAAGIIAILLLGLQTLKPLVDRI